MPSSLAVLRDFMLQRYDDLKARLTRRLGCADMASDALQDTWLRLEGKDELGPVDSPARTCCGWRSMWRWTSSAPKTAGSPPARPRPCSPCLTPRPVWRRRRKAEELDTLVRVMGELSERQRGVLLAVRLEATAAGRGGDAHGCVVAHRGARIAQRA